jgi:hypothetical protein
MAIGYNESKNKSFLDEPYTVHTRYEPDGFLSYTFAYGGNTGWIKSSYKELDSLQRWLESDLKKIKDNSGLIIKKPKDTRTLYDK